MRDVWRKIWKTSFKTSLGDAMSWRWYCTLGHHTWDPEHRNCQQFCRWNSSANTPRENLCCVDHISISRVLTHLYSPIPLFGYFSSFLPLVSDNDRIHLNNIQSWHCDHADPASIPFVSKEFWRNNSLLISSQRANSLIVRSMQIFSDRNDPRLFQWRFSGVHSNYTPSQCWVFAHLRSHWISHSRWSQGRSKSGLFWQKFENQLRRIQAMRRKVRRMHTMRRKSRENMTPQPTNMHPRRGI